MKLTRSQTQLLMFVMILFGSVAFVMVWFNDLLECEAQVISKNVSPDGNLVAVVYGRTCGSTEGYTTHVSLLKDMVKTPSSAGNILVVDSNYQQAPSDDLGITTIAVEWYSQRKIVLTYNKKVRIFRSNNEFNGVTVEHRLRE